MLYSLHCPQKPSKYLNSFHGGMFKHDTKFYADSLLYSLGHFESNGHTVHMLTQWHLPPPLTSTVKSSLFTCVHSSPLSLAARLHWGCTNRSCYINNGWTLVRQTCVCVYTCIYIHTYIHTHRHMCTYKFGVFIYVYVCICICIWRESIYLIYLSQAKQCSVKYQEIYFNNTTISEGKLKRFNF